MKAASRPRAGATLSSLVRGRGRGRSRGRGRGRGSGRGRGRGTCPALRRARWSSYLVRGRVRGRVGCRVRVGCTVRGSVRVRGMG